jgi:hypothetical protein
MPEDASSFGGDCAVKSWSTLRRRQYVLDEMVLQAFCPPLLVETVALFTSLSGSIFRGQIRGGFDTTFGASRSWGNSGAKLAQPRFGNFLSILSASYRGYLLLNMMISALLTWTLGIACCSLAVLISRVTIGEAGISSWKAAGATGERANGDY